MKMYKIYEVRAVRAELNFVVVILSGATVSRSEAVTKSEDPWQLNWLGNREIFPAANSEDKQLRRV
jgi:hypothetical protein